MFREMRRKKQMLDENACIQILNRGTAGVLAAAGDDGYPYAVPLSYVYDNGKIYFHSAKSGHKIDAVMRNEKVSFCVIDQDEIVPQEYTTYYRSVIAFGRIRILEDEAEKKNAAEILAEKYSPGESAQNRSGEIARHWNRLCMLEMNIEHMTGKEAIELVRKHGEDAEIG